LRGSRKEPNELLSTVIQVINERFAAEFDAQDLVDDVTQQLLADEIVQQAAAANDTANFKFIFDDKLDKAWITVTTSMRH